ncbi:TadE/TadG family type IV pilus assembly protein [Streptomyces sp. NPDC006296]|uniref:TadE/TadG family type IV pilus assembly protein n=1 Tax=Streptomyces sp. NPDC006296 TaxID=3156746 RepID=UPI0033A93BB3
MRSGAGRRDDRGSTALEYLGFLPVLILIGLAGIQLGLIAYTAQQAGTGARAAARTASQDAVRGSYERVGRASMTGWVAQRARITPPSGGDSVTVTVSVSVPDVLLGLLGDRTVEKSATMPRD